MNIKLKNVIFLTVLFLLFILISEFVNIASNPNSPGTAIINSYFIKKSIQEAGLGNIHGSLLYLNIASKINIIGEYGPYRKLMKHDFAEKIDISDNQMLKTDINNYMRTLTLQNITNREDQGLGYIFYNLAKIAYPNNSKYAEYFLKQAMYNNPEFASFHADLINYYFILENMDEVNNQMNYCLKFNLAKTLCGQYKDDSLRLNIAQEFGFMSTEVEKYYLGY